MHVLSGFDAGRSQHLAAAAERILRIALQANESALGSFARAVAPGDLSLLANAMAPWQAAAMAVAVLGGRAPLRAAWMWDSEGRSTVSEPSAPAAAGQTPSVGQELARDEAEPGAAGSVNGTLQSPSRPAHHSAAAAAAGPAIDPVLPASAAGASSYLDLPVDLEPGPVRELQQRIKQQGLMLVLLQPSTATMQADYVSAAASALGTPLQADGGLRDPGLDAIFGSEDQKAVSRVTPSVAVDKRLPLPL